MYVFVCYYVYVTAVSTESIRPSAAGVTIYCDQPDLGAGNWIQALCKSSFSPTEPSLQL